MSEPIIGVAGIFLFLFLICLRVPIAYAMAIVGAAGFALLVSPSAALSMLATEVYSNFSSYSLSMIPMFIWMGFLAYYSAIGSKLYRFAYCFIGHRPGGLAIATQVACAIFGAVCGSNTATAATMGAIALPEMKKYRYDDSLSTASVAAGGALGILIPPSVIFIVYGVATGQSVGKLFVAGVVPGILLMLFYIIAIWVVVLKRRDLAPAGERASWAEKLDSLRNGVLEVLVVFIISLGGLFAGWFTPAEAGAVGCAGILLITMIRRQITLEGFWKSLRDTTRTTAMIMFMVTGAMVFGRFMAVTRLPFELAGWVSGLNLHPLLIMLFILFIYLVLGCFIDALALILLTLPIFYPVVANVLKFDPIWFGVIIAMVVAIGVITPPVGMNVFIVKGIAENVSVETVFKGVWPFLLAAIACVLLLIVFPQIVTFLPNVLY
ncbi:tripartite ATP-independent transporter DctM subunit [Caldicoprobacter guelmensis]|uniref:TRAP transporter large permease n=1 Tax=Caldicoprobacter guelmensis TaxID=1170224 RepID=UPI001956B68F|nr:TRAP transporter large permease [Caldicoprobacter guelmensis]MBM7581860.1 tripartite ATP-independent transporter DctM subunit [Caldicoprobacter guelmensis]